MKRDKPQRPGTDSKVYHSGVTRQKSHVPWSVNVRTAKDRLSSLLEQAAQGKEVVITSDGRPKAKLVPIQEEQKPFRVDWEMLRSSASPRGPRRAEEVVRNDRDTRA